MLSDSLLIWRIDAHGADLRRTAIDATFRARVARDVEAVRDPDTVLSIDAASHLYSMLIAPIGRGLPLRATLVIAADGFLNEVPFAGLFDSEQHRFLVESHPIAIASSTSSQAPSEQSYGSVAVIAAPTSPLSDDLAHAGQEADAIGGAIPAKIIRGVDATAERLLSCLGRYAAVHYSGHSESMARGDSGRLLLTPDAHHADGALYGAEVRMKRADGTGLVVLNSCSGGSGKVSSARVGSMARDFIEAGVPRVLAGLWRVDDAAAAHFSSIFYRSLARGETAESALRAAQLSLARTERFRSPRFWAGYNLFRSERL
jgi:CHAT domain-containing protein